MDQVPSTPVMDTSGRAYVIIVNPSRPAVFRALQENFQERVIWDRRASASERRAAQRRTGRLSVSIPGRRESERRSAPPPTWSDYGFILALVTDPVSDRKGQEAR